MTPENQTKDPAAAKKQKIIIVVIVAIVLLVLWQVLGIGGGESSTPAPSPVASAPAKPGAPGNAMQASASAPAMAMPAPAAAPDNTLKQEKISVTSAVSTQQQQSQTEYVASLSKLQMLKLQREIDETKMAIATAELNRMTAEKNIADLITSKADVGTEGSLNGPSSIPMPPTIIAPQSAAPANPVSQGAPNGSTGGSSNNSNNNNNSNIVAELPYTLLSVAYEGRKWAAVLSSSGKMFNVNVGDTLPLDSSMVVAIDKQSVTLKLKNKTRTLNISSTM
jgi:hypothetical protein